ncbi:hypothetical protein Tco_1174418 [Tanacetum coccineum]
MSSMQEDIQCAGSDTRPPMLDRTDFESWQQCIRLYCLGKDNGENIMKSIKEGPFQMGTVSDVITGGTEGAVQQGPVRARVLNDLSAEEKERYKADIRATNILLQGIPKDIYSLINHYTDAKDIWENVKMILEGSELTKDDRESQLYDEFEHFRQIKGETIQGYYVRFTKLINDMRNIKMTMSRMQLNSKFVNNMLPEWSRFITEVKLNRGLKESNCDQLYAYLKQHEVHANENRIMMERFGQPNNDPLALVSDASVQQYPTQSSKSPQSSTEPYPSDNFQMNSGSSSTENLIESLSNSLALLTQSYKSHLPQTNNQLRASSNARNKAMVQTGKVRGSDESGAVLDEEQLLFLTGEQVTNVDDNVDDSPEDDLALLNYMEDNEDHVVQRDVSSVRNDALMSILDEMHEQGVQSRLGQISKDMIKNLEHQIQEKDNVIRHLKDLVANVNDRSREPYNAIDVTALIEQNDCDRVELEKVKQHYKELLRVLKAQFRSKEACFTSDLSKPKVLASLASILRECQKLVREIVEEALELVKNHWIFNLTYTCNTLSYLKGTSLQQHATQSAPESSQTNFHVIPSAGECTSTVKTVLELRESRSGKPKGQQTCLITVVSRTRVWKATGKLFADIGYQWRPTGKKLTLGKLDCGSQWRPTGKKFALGEMCHLTKLSVKCRTGHALVSGLRLFKTYDGESFKAREFCGKVIGRQIRGMTTLMLSWVMEIIKHTCFVHDINGTYILKGSRSTNLYMISMDEMMNLLRIACCPKLPKSNSWLWAS